MGSKMKANSTFLSSADYLEQKILEYGRRQKEAFALEKKGYKLGHFESSEFWHRQICALHPLFISTLTNKSVA